MLRNWKNKLWTTVYVVLLVLTVALVLKLGAPRAVKTQKVGFITSGSTVSPGWSSMNYQGVRAACQTLGVELVSRDHIPENDGSCLQAVQELAEQDVEMIILSSPGYNQEMEPYFSQYPQISFYGIYADSDAPNITSYSTRLYQVRYLSGIIAGIQTKTGKIGFVAALKQPEIYRGIDAFALGVRRVNPQAEVVVAWSGETDNREKEMQAAQALIQEEKVDVITYHQDRNYVVEAAEQAGIASIGYYQEVPNTSDLYLTCATCDWSILYTEIIRECLRGQSTNLVNNWLGLESGAVLLTHYSPMVPQKAIQEVEQATEEIISGRDVFTGKIYDNEGNLRCGPGEAMSDETLMRHIDWLVEGVRVYE